MLAEGDLGAFGALSRAIGLTTTAGANAAWFGDPMGGSAGNPAGLKTIVSDPAQREALLSFVDEILGPPEGRTVGTQRWVPLFAHDDPAVRVSAVVETLPGAVRLGVAVEHSTGDTAPFVATRLHVPLVQLPNGGTDSRPSGGADPRWLLLGHDGGGIGIEVDATFATTPPVPGEASLGGARVRLDIPTGGTDTLAFDLDLVDLQLPGATAPTTQRLDLDSLDEITSDVAEFVVGLVRAQAAALDLDDPAFRHLAGLTGALGLRTVPLIPPLPVADLLATGPSVLVAWFEQILSDDDALDAWLAELARLVGGTAQPDRNAVSFSLDDVVVLLGLRVTPGSGGSPALALWAELGYPVRTGVRAGGSLDLLRLDTGTGAVTAIPQLRAEAVFGADAGGSRLIPGGAVQIGSVHVGVALDESRRPGFALTLHDVDVTVGGAPRHHDLLDLSSPDAALDALDSAVDAALGSALDALGDAGTLLKQLLGISPVGGVGGISVVDLIGSPAAAVRGYYRRLLADADAMPLVLGSLRALLTGTAVASATAVPGLGTPAEPWRVALRTIGGGAGLGLAAWQDGGHLRVAAAADLSVPVLAAAKAGAAGLRATSDLRLALLDVDLDAGTLALASDALARLQLRSTTDAPAELSVGPLDLQFTGLGVEVGWRAGRGLRFRTLGDGLAVVLPQITGSGPGDAVVEDEPLRLDLPLPQIDSTGRLSWSPDWDDVEVVLGRLLSALDLPVLDAAAQLLGWSPEAVGGVHLSLAALVTDPETTLLAWLADLALGCGELQGALQVAAQLLSGFRLSAPYGRGRADDPYRCPVAGEPAAPALVAWTEPPCPPRPTLVGGPYDLLSRLDGWAVAAADDALPVGAQLVAALRQCATDLPDLDDLLFARPGLARGFDDLVGRWAGTDGVTGPAGGLPDDVESMVLPGYGYAELAALGRGFDDIVAGLPGSGAVLHLGCDADWGAGHPASELIDATGGPTASTPVAARVAAAGNGRWYVRLAGIRAASASRPDRDAVAVQVARLAEVLADRTAPVVLVGYGAAGAAAIRAASAQLAGVVSAVVTVGTPWSPVVLTALQTGPGGGALRLLRQLAPTTLLSDVWPDDLLALQASSLARGVDLVRRGSEVTVPGDLPSAGAETRPDGIPVRAVFGTLGGAEATSALMALLVESVRLRAEAAASAVTVTSPRPDHLYLGLDVPALEADLGGISVGAGVRVRLAHLARATTAGARPTVEVVPSIGVRLELGVTDGWLLGGPGATSTDLEVRWLEVQVELPIGMNGGPPAPGSTQLVLHDARAYDAFRERWVVRADGSPSLTLDLSQPTTALPEVKMLIGEVIGRIRTAVPPLGRLLEAIGLVRAGGLDPGALDRLLFEPGATLRPVVAAAPGAVADALRTLLGVPADPARPATEVELGRPGQRVRFDLASSTVSAEVTVTAEEVMAGAPPLSVSLSAGPTGAGLDVTLGVVDPAAGGAALRLSAAAGAELTLRLDHRPPADPGNAGATRSVALLPVPDVAALTDFVALLLPAALLQGLAATVRAQAEAAGREALDAALTAVGLLGASAANGSRSVLLPLGLLTDPGAWLTRRSDPLAAAVALLDALAPLVVPDRGTAPGWPLDPAFGLTYQVVAGRLELVAHLEVTEELDGEEIRLEVATGLAVTPGGALQPLVSAELTVAGWGAAIAAQPSLTVSVLRPAPATPILIHPGGPGLGGALAVGTSLLPTVLNALAGHRSDTGSSLAKDVGAAIYQLGEAMGLTEGPSGARLFTLPLLTAFAADPAAALVSRLPALASAGLSALVDALDPDGTLVRSTPLSSTVRRLSFGTTGAIHLDLDGSASPAIELGGWFDLQGSAGTPLGRVALERLRLTPTGVQVDVRLGPVLIDLGATVLRPVIAVRAGVSAGTFTRMLGIGVGLDDSGASSVEFRWALDASAPQLYAVTRAGLPGASTESLDDRLEIVALQLASVAVSLAAGVLTEQLDTVITDDATAKLQGVVFRGGGLDLDPTLFADLLVPERLLDRLAILAWNCAQAPALALTIEGVTLALASVADGPDQRVGLSLSLTSGTRYALAEGGEVDVHLEVDASWISPTKPAGLSILVLKGPSATDLDLDFALVVAGLGLRFSQTSGPLVSLGAISLDGLALHLYGEASSSGVGGGVRLQLAGLAVAPAGQGEGNPMANALVSDAGAAGANNRPSFSPSLAIQKHPGRELSVGLRAGDPPGPWWVVVQRQLGPLYLERIGLNTVEDGGRVVRISLLFTGSVSLFGLTAAVDQLSLSWHGGDVLSVSSWSADLMGLAVSAEMAGVSLSGGLLKSEDGGVTSYVGMLVGRFATYGLSVFGGYATDPAGHASFFVFGAVTGPIGGPPAFFLTGLGGGLGINRGLVIPDDLSRFGEYPFIQALDPAAPAPDNPMDQLRRLNVYFPHAPGNFWFAAGISFTCFALVDGIAVVAVAFGDGLEINLLGLARLALPRPGAALVSIELALLARFSTREGVFLIKAQLTDNSWLLYEDIRLTGGFAFALWWKGPLAGQFVITMGGYHPDFHREGYPDVPRLGLVWRISSAISMKGESYFALTSEALMAGTAVEVSVDFGWVWAKISFGADGIVYFDPFFFDVRAYCRISAGIDVDLGLFSVSMSATLGASIHVWGPEFAGEVVFEIGPCDVPIRFGPQAKQPGRTLDWSGFVTKYLEDAGGGRARALSGITGRGTLPTSTGGAQGAPSADGSAGLPFRVFAEFEISLTTTVPTTTFTVGAVEKNLPATLSNGAAARLGLAPMGAGELTSRLSVVLKEKQGGGWVDHPDGLQRLAGNLVAGSPTEDGSRTTTDAFPTGVWGEPKALEATVKPIPSADVLVTGNRLVLVAGVETMTRGPEIDYYQVTSGRRPLPLSAAGDDRVDLLQAATAVGSATPATADAALLLAAQTLFDPRTAGESGALGRAAYAFDRVSPPRFGNLADGMAPVNGASGARADAPPPPAKTAPEVRTPFVADYLASGIGASRRAATTTVSDERIKRRIAPSTASVRGRLGLHLPAVLQQAPPPAVSREGTVVAALALPRTDVLGAVRTVALGPVGQLGLNAAVGGLQTSRQRDARGRRRGRGPRDTVGAGGIGTGDVVALQLPDSAIDTSERRPTLTIRGRARVVVLAAHGVLHDDDVVDGELAIPPGARLVGVQADGDADAVDGCSGWHERSRVALLAHRAAIGAGCTIVVDGQGADSTGWGLARDLTADAAEVSTRFTRPMRTVALALTGDLASDSASPDLDRTAVHLVGARLLTRADGSEEPPTMITLGETVVLVYAVLPDANADSLTVAVTVGPDWTVTGVLGAGAPGEPAVDAAELATRISRHGLAAQTAQLTVVQGPGCTADWSAG